jgi:GNAT superfamily N-acetyltransferase
VRVSYGLPEASEPRGCPAPAGCAGLRSTATSRLVRPRSTRQRGWPTLVLPGLPEHRGKGAQSALLAARIHRAVELGCDLLVTETGEQRDDRPSNSYRNILRAGFTEDAVTANWLGRS